MPHIIIEYSEGLSSHFAMRELVDNLHSVAMSDSALPTGGIRSRAYPAALSAVGDGQPDRNFIYIIVRLGQGRSDDVKRRIGDSLFRALTEFTEAHSAAGHPLSLGLEIQEIEKNWTWKKNNIHDIIKGTHNG